MIGAAPARRAGRARDPRRHGHRDLDGRRPLARRPPRDGGPGGARGGRGSAGAASFRPLVDGFPYLEAEVTWAVERELAQTLDDVLVRRIRLAPELRDRGASIAPRRGRDHGAAPRLGRRPVRPRGRGLPRRRPSRVRRAGMTDRTVILALDQGTTSSRAIAFDRSGTPRRQRPARVPAGVPVARPRHPRPRGHLDEPARASPRRSSRPSAARSTSPRSASPTSARRPSCGTAPPAGPSPRRSSGRAGSPPRSANGCARTGHEPFVRERTGLPIDAYFSGPKIRHILEEGGLRARAERGELAFGTVDTWLTWRLTDGRVHATDVSNASRTLLCNIHTLDWDDDLLRLMEVPRRDAAGDPPVVGGVGRDRGGALRPPDPDRRRRGRPAGGDVRAGVLRAGRGQEHVRHRGVPPRERRRRAGRERSRAAVDRAVAPGRGRAGRLRARGLGVRRRRRGPVAARRPEGRLERRGGRGADARGRGHRRRLPRAGLRRARRPVLGPAGARPADRADPRHRPARDRAGHDRVDRLPGARRRRGDGGRSRRAAHASCGSTAARPATTTCCSSRPTSWASPWSGPGSRRRPRGVPPRWPAWPSGSGRRSTSWRRSGPSTGGSSPPCRRPGAPPCWRGWHRAVERSRDWAVD